MYALAIDGVAWPHARAWFQPADAASAGWCQCQWLQLCLTARAVAATVEKQQMPSVCTVMLVGVVRVCSFGMLASGRCIVAGAWNV